MMAGVPSFLSPSFTSLDLDFELNRDPPSFPHPSTLENRIIQHLYSPTSNAQPHEQQELQRQLVEAQKSDASWGLIGPLLGHPDRNVRFFGAHTASVKITRDWDTLPEEQRGALLNSMLEWTGQTASLGQENAVVLRKLFVALSSLIIRLSPNSFPHPLLTLLTLLTPAPSATSPPSLALPLEFFQIIIEEVSRTGLIGTRKIEIHDVLEEGSEVAVGSCLGVLRRWLEDGGGDKSRQREEELSAATSCLEAWIGWGLSGELLHHSLPLVIALLSHPDSFIQASDCLQQILLDSVLKDGRGSKVLTDPILAWLPSVAGPIAESCFSTGDVDEAAQSLCKLLVALGEHSAHYLALNLALPEVQTFFTLMLGFSSLPGYYGLDEDVSEMTLGFWSLFQEALTASPHIETADAPVPGNEWNIALQIFGELLRRMRGKCVLPRDGGGWMKDQTDKFRVYRNDVGDTLVTTFYVLRDEMLSFLINSLASDLSLSEPPWEEIEASLHCLRAAQEAVPEDENTFLPRFFSPEILGRLPTAGDSRTRATTLALLGDYSSWFHAHPTHVISAISYIVPALDVPSLCTSAAQALKTLCDLCRTSLTGHIGEFGSLYGTVEDRIDPEEKAKVLEAITSVVQALPPMDAVEPVKSIVDPIVNKLLHALSLSNQLPAEAKALSIQQVISLTAVAKGLTPLDDFDLEPEAEEQMFRGDAEKARADPRLVELRTRMLEGIARMVELWSTDGEVADEISRLLKSMTTSTTSPTLLSLDSEPLIRLVASAAERNLNGVWLSLAEILVGRLAPPPGFGISNDAGSQKAQRLVREVAGSMIWAGANVLSAGPEVMTSHPDVVEGLFKFAGTVAARFPVSLLAPPHEVLDAMMQLSIVGLGLQERYSIQAVTGFLTTTISRSRSPQDLLEAFNIVLRTHGHSILQAILFGAGGHCPRSVIPHLAELLASLVARLPELCAAWLTTILSVEGFPDPRATAKAKEKLKNAIFKGRTTRKVREALNEFALVSRGLEGSAYAASAPL
ncbi:armadillo-type protein [Mrakia frigida]|uniref:Kap122p n=1 Tax=Mrakia frigida TaxID=29902 RepID=UPI003FCC04CF